MDHRLPTLTPPQRLGLARDALDSMERALHCLDELGAHQCGAHLDYAIHLLRQWCVSEDDPALPG